MKVSIISEEKNLILLNVEPAIPSFLTKDIKEKCAFLDQSIEYAEISKSGDTIRFFLTGYNTQKGKVQIAKKFERILNSMTSFTFEPRISILEDFMDRDVSYYVDPMVELIKTHEVIQEGAGYFSIGPKISKIISFFEAKFLAVADELLSAPYRFPALIPAEYMERVQYFKNFPHSLSFVSHLCEDLDIIENFSKNAVCNNHTIEAPANSFSPPRVMLTPTVCHHLYYALKDQIIDSNGITVTASGNCFRYESSNMISLERLWNFTMREIIFVGPSSFVASNLEKVRLKMRPILESFGLAYKIENASDPFFVGTFNNQTAYQNALNLKFEVRAFLPFKDDTIAIGSYNRHEKFFGQNLNFKMDNGELPDTGCVGFGFERLAFAFISQHGLHPENWPYEIKNYFKNI